MPKTVALICVALVASALCAPGQETAPAPKPWDPAQGRATLKGCVRFEGPPKAVAPVDPATDPWCAKACADKTALLPRLANDDGTLREAFVWISKGLEVWTFPLPEQPAALDQKDCVFVPHVFGIRARQGLVIRNSDGTSHNVQALPRANAPFNFMQSEQGATRTVTFDRAETMIRLKCNIHSWMGAWVGVLDHPYWAVSGADGTFAIERLPPGRLTIAVWHEHYGRQEREIDLVAGDPVVADFLFKPKGK